MRILHGTRPFQVPPNRSCWFGRFPHSFYHSLVSKWTFMVSVFLSQKITFLSFTIMEGKKLVFGVIREFFNSRFKMTHLCFPNVMNMICFFYGVGGAKKLKGAGFWINWAETMECWGSPERHEWLKSETPARYFRQLPVSPLQIPNLIFFIFFLLLVKSPCPEDRVHLTSQFWPCIAAFL